MYRRIIMTIDKEKIKAALDDFEDDKFSDAKDILKGEISKQKNEWLKSKLELKDDIDPVVNKEEIKDEE